MNGSTHVNLLESAKFSNAVVQVGHKITHLQTLQFLQGDGVGLVKSVFQAEALVALKKFVVRIHHPAACGVFPSGVQGAQYGLKFNQPAHVLKQGAQSVYLGLGVGHQNNRSSQTAVVLYGVCQQGKILTKRGRRQGLPMNGGVRAFAVYGQASLRHSRLPARPIGKQFVRFSSLDGAGKLRKSFYRPGVIAF